MLFKVRVLPIVIIALVVVLIPIVAFAQGDTPPDGLEPVLPFFNGYSLEELYLVLVTGAIGLLQGFFPGLSVFEMLKKWLKIDDLPAVILVLVVSVLFGVLAIYLVGYFSSEIVFDAELLSGLVFTVFSMSQVGYQALKSVSKLPK